MAAGLLAALALLQVAPSVASNPRVQAVLNRAPLPRPGDVALRLLVSSDRVTIGEQVDIVTAAWFPRELLTRLRRPPALRSPSVDGVYTAMQPPAAVVADTRLINDTWYDLYVAHQVIFPLTTDTIRIPPATLSFSVPTGRQYFSEERLHRRSTDSLRIVVLGIPPPPGPDGPPARDLDLSYELRPEPARAGEPIPVELVLAGGGNVPLWPAPQVAWPEGTRGYADHAEEETRLVRGVLRGVKRYRFSVLADSAGSLALPEVRYPWFDLESGSWREAVAPPVVLPVLPPQSATDRRLPPPLMVDEPLGLPRWGVPGWLVALLASLPPAIVLLGRRLGRRPRRLVPRGASPLERLAALVRSRVPETDRGRPDVVTAALREAGLDPSLSDRIAGLYEEITNARFDPGRRVDEVDLGVRAGRLLRELPNRIDPRVPLLPLLGLLTFLTPLSTLSALPAFSQDSLYRSGLYAAAVREYAVVVTADPSRADAWYNLGAAAWAAGSDGQAAAAWLTAHRLAPRSAIIRDAWAMVAPRSADLERLGRVSFLTPPELLVVTLLVWAVTWLLIARRAHRSTVVAWMVGTAVVAGSALVVDYWYHRPIAVITGSAVIRDAPHGLAQSVSRLEELQVVRIQDRRPGWLLVVAEGGRLGWLPRGSLAPVGRLDSEP